MHYFLILSALITLAAIFSYVNERSFKLPSGIGLMLMGTLVSIAVVLAGNYSPKFTAFVVDELTFLNFPEFVLGIVLSFLLFAGSLHVDIHQLRNSAKSIISFAFVGTAISTFLVGYALYYILQVFGIEVPLIACFLFGSLISPTDPIAVLGILKKSKISPSIQIKITGESLFNDGVAVVFFATILQTISTGAENFSMMDTSLFFLQEVAGGVLAGVVIGMIGYQMMKTIDHFQTEILISLAMVMGGYSLCYYLHLSGPLAIVIAGLITGNKSRAKAMSDMTRDYLEKFWEVMDEVLNTLLFLLIGLEIAIVAMTGNFILIGLTMALLIVFIRYIALQVPVLIFRLKEQLEKNTLEIMAWGGLRGGISIALVLSLPASEYKSILVSVTFIVVLFSILVQGFSMGHFIKYLNKRETAVRAELNNNSPS